ncbi:MAG: PAS domain S-box protein [Candidatus Tantalella remota]|nr:PAS domain S-box protein [Candidatus Tantalella remota]
MMYLTISNLILLAIVLWLVGRNFIKRQDQRTFQRLIDHLNAGYYKCRIRDGVILDANKSYAKILELDMDPREIVGHSLGELFIYIDGEESIREQLKVRKELKNYEYRFKTLKGRNKVVLHNSYIVMDPYTREEVVEALVEDVTEEKYAYERMKESQEKYERLFKDSGDMVIICRLDDMSVEDINPVTEVITGYSGEELKSQPFENILHPARRGEMKGVREDLLFSGAAQLETMFVCKNGTYREVMMTFSIVEIAEDRYFMAVVKDISSLVKEQREQQLRKMELEDFWKASSERETRIMDLRQELDQLKQQVKLLKAKQEPHRNGTDE